MTIGEIKNIYREIQDSEIDKLKSFVNSFTADERTGVIAVVGQAQKRITAYENELLRTEEMYKFENKYWDMGHEFICGIDEVGRGPLAGPVVACAVILPKNERILYLNDSKQVPAKKREELFDVIMEKAVADRIRKR